MASVVFGNMSKSSFECITFLGEDRTEVIKTRARAFVSTEFKVFFNLSVVLQPCVGYWLIVYGGQSYQSR